MAGEGNEIKLTPKKYRPAWWEQPYKNIVTTDSRLLTEVYEAGADAMLEALRKIAKQRCKEPVTLEKIKEATNPKGVWLYIPD
jgi:hypothetical protein